jgi:hypothetical protein
VVWVEGDAGYGKTALVRHVIASLPAEFIVLSAEADELAREYAFGVVSQLGVATSSGSFAAGMELLRMAGERTDHRPVLVVAEDLHWADISSREALATMARRLENECVALLATSRPGASGADGWDRTVNDESRCRTIRLGPMPSSRSASGRPARRSSCHVRKPQAASAHRRPPALHQDAASPS